MIRNSRVPRREPPVYGAGDFKGCSLEQPESEFTEGFAPFRYGIRIWAPDDMFQRFRAAGAVGVSPAFASVQLSD